MQCFSKYGLRMTIDSHLNVCEKHTCLGSIPTATSKFGGKETAIFYK